MQGRVSLETLTATTTRPRSSNSTRPNMPTPPRRWAELPPDVLTLVSGRLHDATDFVRFHAVCTSWRGSLSPKASALRPVLFPWLVAPPSGRRLSVIRPRCAFSKTSYYKDVPSSFYKLGCVARADGTAYWFYNARDGPKLVDPLTGEATPLPPFPPGDKRKMGDKSRGVVYGDGTVFLYNFSKSDDDLEQRVTLLRAAILSPGSTEWTVVQTWLRIGASNEAFGSNQCLAAYHDGKILACVDWDHRNDIWHLLVPSAGGVHTRVVENKDRWGVGSSHILESHGELLRVSIMAIYFWSLPLDWGSKMRQVAVLVQALEEEVGTDNVRTVRWARRDGVSFADRVMFLGFPSSFTVDAARFHGMEDGVIGGCIYFFQRCICQSTVAVLRHNLIVGKTKFIEYLTSKWSDHKNNMGMWLVPQPDIAPVQVIKERTEALEAYHPTPGSTSIRKEKRSERSKEPFFGFVVQNLPPDVDRYLMCRFFRKHGQVLTTEVISKGKGCVTMAMVAVERSDDAEATLNGLVLNGYNLVVSVDTTSSSYQCPSCKWHCKLW